MERVIKWTIGTKCYEIKPYAHLTGADLRGVNLK